MALAGQGKTKGMVAQLGFPATCNQSVAAIIPTRRIRSRYLYWWLTANYFNIRNMAGGEARDGLNLEVGCRWSFSGAFGTKLVAKLYIEKKH